MSFKRCNDIKIQAISIIWADMNIRDELLSTTKHLFSMLGQLNSNCKKSRLTANNEAQL